MSRRPRRNHTPAFKAKATLAAIEHCLSLFEQFDVHPNQITSWQAQLSRRLLSWRLSITMEAAFCVETLEDALARHEYNTGGQVVDMPRFTCNQLLSGVPDAIKAPAFP